MKRFFLICAAACAVLYLGGLATLPKPPKGVTQLRWTSDLSPTRTIQTDTFARMYPGTTVIVDPGAESDYSKILVQCSTGVGSDIMDVGSVDGMRTLVNAGVLLDLTPYAKKMGFDPSHTYPALRDALLVDGRQYRFPCNVSADCVVYNKAIFDDHGVPYPKSGWTYADFVRTAEEIRDRPSKSGKKHIPVANLNGLNFYEDLLVGHGGRLFSADGLHSTVDSPESVAALQDYYNMMYVACIMPTPSDASAMSEQGGWGSGPLNWFAGSQAAMLIIGRWFIIQMPNYPNLNGKLGSIVLPRVGNRPSAAATDTRAAAINAKSPHWRESLRFLQFLASPQYNRLIAEEGDALPPDPNLARTGAQLVTPTVPDPAFHQPFIDAMRNARPMDFSPYMDPMEVTRWLTDAIARAENRLQTPSEAMHELAQQIDNQIQTNLERQPNLQVLYLKRTGHSYVPAEGSAPFAVR